MSQTIKDALQVYNSISSNDYESSGSNFQHNISIVQVLALIAIAEELEKANQLKEKELKRIYGNGFV
jgi:hypothetical protein